MHLQPTGVAFVLYWVTLTESNSQPISTGIIVFSDVIGGFRRKHNRLNRHKICTAQSALEGFAAFGGRGI